MAGAHNGPYIEGVRAPFLTADRGMHSRERSQSNMSEMFDDAASTAGSMQGMNQQQTAAANGNGHGFAAAETSGRGTRNPLCCLLPCPAHAYAPQHTRTGPGLRGPSRQINRHLPWEEAQSAPLPQTCIGVPSGTCNLSNHGAWISQKEGIWRMRRADTRQCIRFLLPVKAVSG